MFGNKGMCRRINTNTNCWFSIRLHLSLHPSFASQAFYISEDLMNISLWVGEHKTNMSLDLPSLFVFPRRRECETHLKPCETEAHPAFWHRRCFFSPNRIHFSPPIITVNSSGRDAEMLAVAGTSPQREWDCLFYVLGGKNNYYNFLLTLCNYVP